MHVIELYDLAGEDDDRRISPFCWCIRMCLAHKGLNVSTIPWRLSERDVIERFGSNAVPVIVDKGKSVHDSWRIAAYLDDVYPERPLFACEQARAYSLFLHHWMVRAVHGLIVPIILEDVLKHLHPKDLSYFRTTRERAFGTTLEAVMDRSPAAFIQLNRALSPLRRTLKEQAFIAGSAPAFADYTVFGAFQWARSCSPQIIVKDGDAVLPWLDRMLGLFDGLAARAKGYDAFGRS